MRASLRGSECPECGSVRTLTKSAGFDANAHRIRLRGCATCEHQFTTVEVVLPFSFTAVDVSKRERRHHKTPERVTPATFHVEPNYRGATTSLSITMRPGRRSNRCRKGLHDLTGGDVYVNPKNGQRTCNPCRRASATARYRHMMDRMPPSIRAERNARNAAYLRERYAAGLRGPRRQGAREEAVA